MRLALLTEAADYRRMWSGTVDQMVRALRAADQEVEVLHPSGLAAWAEALTFAARLQRRATGHDLALDRTEWAARLKGRAIERSLARLHDVDALLAPVASTLLPFVRTDLPVVYVSDATLPLMTGYYDRFAHFSERTLRRAVRLERRAMRVADLAVFPTRWAAGSARTDLDVPEDRVLVAPFGPNLAAPPARAAVAGPRRPGPFRMLFCAVEWERKGGDLALGAAAALHRRGLETELTILGVTPPAGAAHPPGVTVIPYLDKREPEAARRFHDLFRDADLFVMPTRAECFGVVFCEAAAHATPSLATATGGVPEVVRDGETGLLLDPGAGAEAYADAVAGLIADPVRLERMRQAARDDYEARLNWPAWARAVIARTAPLVAARGRGA